MPVSLPEPNDKRLLARKLAEALLSQIPYVEGPYAAMLSVTHPSEWDQLQTRWRQDITDAVNRVEELVDQIVPTISISALSVSVGKWISEESESGRSDSVEFAKLTERFPVASATELEDDAGSWNSRD